MGNSRRPADRPLSRATVRRLGRRARWVRWWFVEVRWATPATESLGRAAMGGDLNALRELAAPDLCHHLDFEWHRWLASQDRADLVAHLGCKWSHEPHAERALTVIVTEPEPAVLTPAMRPGIAVAAALNGHPVMEIARQKILHAADEDLIDDVCRVAVSQPGLAAFCREHGLAPADPVHRATFFLTTGQTDRYREADPDGKLALRVYHEADEAERLRLRTSAVDHGSLARKLTEGHHQDRIDQVRGAELTRLTTAVAARADWSQLWEVILDAAPADAVGLVRLFPAQWQPAGGEDRLLYATLRSAPVDQLAAARENPSLVTTIDPGMSVVCAVAVDESKLALIGLRAGLTGRALVLYELPGGAPLAQREYEDLEMSSAVTAAVYGDIVITTDTSHRVWIHTTGQSACVPESPLRMFTAFASGWAALSKKDLVIGTPQGDIIRRVSLRGLGLATRSAHQEVKLHAIGATGDGSRFALAGDGRIVVVDSTSRHATTKLSDAGDALAGMEVDDLIFLGDGRLVTALRRRRATKRTEHQYNNDRPTQEFDVVDTTSTWTLVRWTVAGDNTLTVDRQWPDFWRYANTEHKNFRATYNVPPSYRRRRPVAVEAVVDNKPHSTPERHRVRLHEIPGPPARILVSGPRNYPRAEHAVVQDAELVTFSHDDPILGSRQGVRTSAQRHGRYLATCSGLVDLIRIHDLVLGEVLALLDRPGVAMTPADHAVVTTMAGYSGHPAVEVLRAFVKHRFD